MCLASKSTPPPKRADSSTILLYGCEESPPSHGLGRRGPFASARLPEVCTTALAGAKMEPPSEDSSLKRPLDSTASPPGATKKENPDASTH